MVLFRWSEKRLDFASLAHAGESGGGAESAEMKNVSMVRPEVVSKHVGYRPQPRRRTGWRPTTKTISRGRLLRDLLGVPTFVGSRKSDFCWSFGGTLRADFLKSRILDYFSKFADDH
jgi:hypothetical protein